MLRACVDSQPMQDLAGHVMLQHHVLNELLLDSRWHNLSSSWRFGKCQVWPGPWHGILLIVTIYVVHLQDRLLSRQLCPTFPPAWKE